MKITKEQLKQIIMEEIASEGVKTVGGEKVVTGRDGDASDEARGVARLEDVIEYLVGQERDDLADPLRKIQDMLDALR